MSSERRYNEEEIAAIFKQAAADQESTQQQATRSGGLTLAEIEQIGEEVGIAPESIARAAAALGRTISAPPPTTFLGFPVGVARTVDLPGAFSDKDWDRLVADLHETFEVPGEVRQDGSLRQWKNAKLHVLVEPTEAGYRLRLRTVEEQVALAKSGLIGGLLFLMMGLFFILLLAAKGDLFVDVAKTIFVSMFSVVGLGGLGAAAYLLPRRRKEQERRMDAIMARAVERAGTPSTSASRTLDTQRAVDLDLSVDTDPTEEEQAPVRRRTRS